MNQELINKSVNYRIHERQNIMSLPTHIIQALSGAIIINNLIIDNALSVTSTQSKVRAIQEKNKLDLSVNHAVLHDSAHAIDDIDYTFEYHTCGMGEVLTVESN